MSTTSNEESMLVYDESEIDYVGFVENLLKADSTTIDVYINAIQNLNPKNIDSIFAELVSTINSNVWFVQFESLKEAVKKIDLMRYHAISPKRSGISQEEYDAILDLVKAFVREKEHARNKIHEMQRFPIDEKNCFVDCEETITGILQHQDTQIVIVTDSARYVVEIDDDQHCCEVFGGYIICEDAPDSFVGTKLLKIYLTDTSLNTMVVKEINEIQNYYDSCWYHNIQFVNIQTTRGLLQFVVYNCHNGYYGHNIQIRKDDKILYEDRI